jgi:hypothetical protein
MADGLRIIFRDATGKIVGQIDTMSNYSQRAIQAMKRSIKDPLTRADYPQHAKVEFQRW